MIPLALVLAAAPPAEAVDVVLPGPVRVRVEAPAGPEWGTFLDKLFDHFDRDRDSTLSAAEAGRVFPLPRPGGTVAPPGRCSRAEFRDHYRRAGFAPVVGVVRPPSADVRRLSAALFRALDRDGDGTISRAEWAAAPALLRRFDENEDEVLDAAELLAAAPADAGPVGSEIRVESRMGDALLVPLPKGGGNKKLILDGGSEVRVTVADAGGGIRAAKEFYLAQFADALAGRAGLTKADLDADAGLQAVAGMASAADRDGDGRLTAGELAGFLDLIALGVECQVVVTVEDRGGSLFDRLDADADGRLDVAELTRAAALPPAERANPVGQYRIEVSRGSVGPAFGPVPIPSRPASRPAGSVAARGPAWFRAMDRNGDGYVSAAEFRGPAARFAALDRDEDGRISADEAGAKP